MRSSAPLVTPTIAIIGATGQLGSDLVQVVREDGRYRVEGFSREELDVTDAVALERELAPGRFAAVVNTAALTNVDLCEERGEDALAVNSTGAYLVARACARAGSKNVLISTDFVFGGRTNRGTPYDEHDSPQPVNIYGASKLAGETLALIASPDTLILRISSVFGKAGARGKGGNFIETILERARAGAPLKVIDDIIMSPTYTVDVARALPELLLANATGVVHLSNAGSCSWFEFAKAALELAGLGVEIEPVSSDEFPRPAKRPRNSALTSRRLEGLIGRAMPRRQEALREYLEENGHLAARQEARQEASQAEEPS
ncbi:MAG: dTDP-4-dehydrorhamnose reductase [Trueperaceae bacterium]